MKTEKSRVLVTAMPRPNEAEAMQTYAGKAHALLKQSGATGIALYNVEEKVQGNDLAMAFVAEFPDASAVKDFFYGTEYQSLLPYREKAFQTFNVHIVSAGEAAI